MSIIGYYGGTAVCRSIFGGTGKRSVEKGSDKNMRMNNCILDANATLRFLL